MNTKPKWYRWLTVERRYMASQKSQQLIAAALQPNWRPGKSLSFELKPEQPDLLLAKAKVSIGTFSYRFGFSASTWRYLSITAWLKVAKAQAGEQEVMIFTKPRPEPIIMLLMLIATQIIGVGLSSLHESTTIQLLAIPLFLLFFWFLYRIQERILIKKMEVYFELAQKEERASVE